MAHLWYVDKGSGEWTVLPLRGGAVELNAPHAGSRRDRGRVAALLLRSRTAAGEQWLLISVALRPLSLNGEPVRTGIRALSDKDEIRLADGVRLFFSTERLKQIEPFPGSSVPCPRCRLPIETGAPSVVCDCGTWLHCDADKGLPCFTYAGDCPVCSRPTELSDTFRWQPSAL
jgi:hypothetical protein